MKSSLIAAAAVALGLPGCSAAPDNPSTTVDDSLLPRDGAVTEYWPNGAVRRERVYRDGQVVSAVERYPNGSLAYEVEAELTARTKTEEKAR